MADLGSGSAAARASSGASASGSASARGSSSSFSSLEDACRASERARLLAPGLAMHEGTPVGTSPAPRPDVQARLEAHALGLGPPHTLVLTGPEGAGKSTELATLASRLERMEQSERRDGRLRASDDPDPDPDDPEGGLASSRAPFVLTHTFADQSFPQDVAHFLERACVALKRRFAIADPVPADPDDLPRTFRAFLEHAAAHRRVLVIVDAAESARVPPYASYAAAAVEGLDPREREPRDDEEHSGEEGEREFEGARVGSRSASEPSAAAPPHRPSSRPPRAPTAVDAHVAWLPRSPPLAVRFVVACREEEDADDDDDASSVAAALIRRAPSAVVAYPMPPLTPEQTALVVASSSPVAMRANDDDNEGGLAGGSSRVVSPTRAPPTRTKPGDPGRAGSSSSSGGSTLDAGYHRSLVVAERVNAKRPHGATPLYARLIARELTALVSATKPSAWVAARAVDEEAEFAGATGTGGGGGPDHDDDDDARAGAPLELPRSVARGIGRLPGTARALARSALAGLAAREGLDPGFVEAACVTMAAARFGADEAEAAEAAAAVFSAAARARGGGGKGGGGGLATTTLRDDDSNDGSKAVEEKDLRRARAAVGALRPWLATRASAEAWAEASAPFEPAGEEEAFFPGDGATRAHRGHSGHSGSISHDEPLAFRDDAFRYAALDLFAPLGAAEADGTPSRVAAHRRLASFFRDEVFGMTGKKVHRRRDRDRDRPAARHLRALAWHASAAGDHALCASVFSRRDVLAAVARPGARAEFAAAAPGRGSRSTIRRRGGSSSDESSAESSRAAFWGAWELNFLSWMDAALLEPDSSTVTGTRTILTSKSGAPLVSRRAAREADLGEMRRSGDALARQMGERAGAALATSAALGWIGARDVAARVLERARQWFGEPKSRSGVTVALALAHASAELAKISKEESSEDFGASLFEDNDAASAASHLRSCADLAKRARGAGELFASANAGRGDHAGILPRPWREACEAVGGAAHCLRAPEATFAHAASVCADVASFELERRGGGGGARRDGGDERVRSLAAHRAKEIDAWRAAATLPGGGGPGERKKVRGEWFEQIQILPRRRVVPPRAPPSRGGVRAGRGPRRGPRGVRRGRRDPHGRPRGGPPRARRRHARGGGGGRRRRRRGRRRRGGD